MHQLTIPRMSRLEATSPKQLMTAAVEWIENNRDGWAYVVAEARNDAELLGRVRVKHAMECLRYQRPHIGGGKPSGPVKLPNALSAAFGRILAAWYPSIAPHIPLTRSKLDGVVVPPRPDWARSL